MVHGGKNPSENNHTSFDLQHNKVKMKTTKTTTTTQNKVFTLKYINLTKYMTKGSGYKFVNLVTALPLYK